MKDAALKRPSVFPVILLFNFLVVLVENLKVYPGKTIFCHPVSFDPLRMELSSCAVPARFIELSMHALAVARSVDFFRFRCPKVSEC